MSRLPIVNARTMELILFHLGFATVRQKGSHVLYRHPDGRTTAIPHHAGRDFARPLIRAILCDINVSPDRFTAIMKEI